MGLVSRTSFPAPWTPPFRSWIEWATNAYVLPARRSFCLWSFALSASMPQIKTNSVITVLSSTSCLSLCTLCPIVTSFGGQWTFRMIFLFDICSMEWIFPAWPVENEHISRQAPPLAQLCFIDHEMPLESSPLDLIAIRLFGWNILHDRKNKILSLLKIWIWFERRESSDIATVVC